MSTTEAIESNVEPVELVPVRVVGPVTVPDIIALRNDEEDEGAAMEGDRFE